MLKIEFKKENYQKKDGEILPFVRVNVINEDNGLHFDFMDFSITLPIDYILLIDGNTIKKDEYNRYILGDYTLSAKYTLAFNILLSEKG